MWIYQNKEVTEVPEKAIGFLYKIIHIPTGMWYIGRKMLYSTKIKITKGKKTKIKTESDWKDYWSSSDEIKSLLEKEGHQNFKREILIFCETKAQMLYGEEAALYFTGSMFDPLCFNSNIRTKIFKKWFTKTPNFHDELIKSIK